jgi:hypothetical protein
MLNPSEKPGKPDRIKSKCFLPNQTELGSSRPLFNQNNPSFHQPDVITNFQLIPNAIPFTVSPYIIYYWEMETLRKSSFLPSPIPPPPRLRRLPLDTLTTSAAPRCSLLLIANPRCLNSSPTFSQCAPSYHRASDNGVWLRFRRKLLEGCFRGSHHSNVVL